MKRKLLGLAICAVASTLSFSISGCSKIELQDDYILQINQSEATDLSNDKIDEVFDSEKVSELMDKLKTMPADIADKLDDGDGETADKVKELTDKVDELTDKINELDLSGKSDDIKSKVDEISDKLDELEDKADDVKDRIDDFKDPIDKEKITDTVDEFESQIDDLQSALNRLGNQ